MRMTKDVRWLDQQITARFAMSGAASMFTPTQMIVLDAVHTLPLASQADLVTATRVDRSTLSDVVRRLADAGFVVRTENPADARAYSVDLTKHGRAKFKLARPELVKVEKGLVVEAKALAVSW